MKRLLLIFVFTVVLSGCAIMDEIYHMNCLKTVMSGSGQLGSEMVKATIERFDAKPADIRKYRIEQPTLFSITIKKRNKNYVLFYQGYVIIKKDGEEKVISDAKYIKDWNLESWGINNEPLQSLLEGEQVDKIILKFKEGEIYLKPTR